MKEISNYYVAEFSQSQRTFHICTCEKMVTRNLAAYHARRPSDWTPVGIFHTTEEAEIFIKRVDPEGVFAL